MHWTLTSHFRSRAARVQVYDISKRRTNEVISGPGRVIGLMNWATDRSRQSRNHSRARRAIATATAVAFPRLSDCLTGWLGHNAHISGHSSLRWVQPIDQVNGIGQSTVHHFRKHIMIYISEAMHLNFTIILRPLLLATTRGRCLVALPPAALYCCIIIISIGNSINVIIVVSQWPPVVLKAQSDKYKVNSTWLFWCTFYFTVAFKITCKMGVRVY